ncbi:MAG: hypothetical protein EHM21_00140 [Chloroflexi bacterium]|nr:MAG: hypothetical protein EHM21_00140 [Chloroflexota bacterium]
MPMSLQVSVRAELLLADARIALERVAALSLGAGSLREVCVPDGSVNYPLLSLQPGRYNGLALVSDKPLQVTLGDPARNTPVGLAPFSVLALLGVDVRADQACFVTYAPGDGSVATCALLVGFTPKLGESWSAMFEFTVYESPDMRWGPAMFDLA